MSDNTVQQVSAEVIEPNVERPHAIGGTQRLYRFANDYGASVIRFQFGSGGSYGAAQGLWEMAVIRYEGSDWEIVYDTPVTDDVMGWLDENAIQEKLRQIRDLSNPSDGSEVTGPPAVIDGEVVEVTLALPAGDGESVVVTERLPVSADNPPDRVCRYCGATEGLKMLFGPPFYTPQGYECYDACGGAR